MRKMTDNQFPTEGNHKILIVDDNPQNLEVLGKILRANSFTIEFAINGETAIEWLSAGSFDLILLDINMPGMNGFDVCSWIRSRSNLKNLPIIFLSADNERDSILKGFDLGAQDYITKPFDSRELLVRVRTQLTLKDSIERLGELNKTLEEKVAERTLQLKEANEKLTEINSKLVGLDIAKAEFLRLISHEIRTPLNGIIGPMELIKETEFPEEIGELMNILDHSVKRLENFSLEALLITRLKTNPTDLKLETINLWECISKVVEDLHSRAEMHDISLVMNLPPGQSQVSVEVDLITKCLNNLIDNAILFSPKGGTVTISGKHTNEGATCEIRDEGKGFTNDQLASIFDLFINADKFRDNSKGIGLPVVKMIMEVHKGEIDVLNRPEGGAAVILSFPFTSPIP